ncbi:solute carrier family 22 member 16 [Protopterus annectens]|uniref:solute carrier family 22 member 16 n=1 Tax=Protopterus annectens TaxID=7888 RepID=UPI001CFBBE60|nr:solute carrier family 22 member 16 [Protopterus annectens]
MVASCELLFDELGHFGRFQASVYFAVIFQCISCGIHYLASVFLAATPNFVCKAPGNVSSALVCNSSRLGLEDIWDLWTPDSGYVVVQTANGDIWELDQCSRFRRDNGFKLTYEYDGNKSYFPCSDGFLYDRAKLKSTIVTDWNLVCDQEWLGKFTQPTFMLGVLFGAMIFGDLADRIGRRPVMWFTSTGQFVFGIAVAFSLEYYSFIILRFLLAMVSSGYLVVVFVYVTEYIGIKARTWASMHVHASFAVGLMMVALIGYLVRTWWIYQIVLSLMTSPFLLCCWMLPETPFYLLTKGKTAEVQRLVRSMAKRNGVTSSCQFLKKDDSVSKKYGTEKEGMMLKKYSILDLFSTWHLACRTFTVWLVWFTGSLGYYVFSLGSVNLGGNAYLNLFLAGAVELPSYIIACIAMDKLGRRNTLVPSLLMSVVACVAVMAIPQDYRVLIIIASMTGKFAIAIAFGLIYLYTAELYPTIVRSLAVGSGSMMCRIGSIVAPFCVYLANIWMFLPQVVG